MIFLPAIIFFFGLIIGSFLNVVILRLNTGRSIAKGRSKCARCSQTLSWYELIPVFSFLGLRGKCKTCKTQISFQYPLVELITGLVFIILYTKIVLPNFFDTSSWIALLFGMVVAALMIVITVYDYRHKIIPDKIVYLLMAVSFTSLIWRDVTVINFSFINTFLAGIIMAAPFFFLWFFSKGRLMGLGDAKLALPMGWLVGLSGAVTTFLLSFWFGAVIGLLLLATSRVHNMKSEIPFAPFMIAAFFVVSVWGVSVATMFPIW